MHKMHYVKHNVVYTLLFLNIFYLHVKCILLAKTRTVYVICVKADSPKIFKIKSNITISRIHTRLNYS